jgi:endonuclease-3
MAPRQKMMKKEAIAEVFAYFQSCNPEPKTELEAPNPFCLLVAVVLSAQATDVGVNKATKALFARYNTPTAMRALGEQGIKRYIKTIGLFNSKAKNIMGLCDKLIHEFGGAIPHDRDKLASLPGVGRKTANVWLNCVLGWPTMAVDTHVFRVANRLGLCREKTPLGVEKVLMKKIPEPYMRDAHHWLILHGRYVCKARTPQCGICGVAAQCTYPDKATITS